MDENNNLQEIETNEKIVEQTEKYDDEGRISYQKTEEVKSTFLKNNILAYLGFITSFFVPFLPILFCIVALIQIKKTNEGGKRAAIFGIFINIILMVIVFILYPMWKSDRERRNNVDPKIIEMCKTKYGCDGDEDNDGFETCSYLDTDTNNIINIECPVEKNK